MTQLLNHKKVSLKFRIVSWIVTHNRKCVCCESRVTSGTCFILGLHGLIIQGSISWRRALTEENIRTPNTCIITFARTVSGEAATTSHNVAGAPRVMYNMFRQEIRKSAWADHSLGRPKKLSNEGISRQSMSRQPTFYFRVKSIFSSILERA